MQDHQYQVLGNCLIYRKGSKWIATHGFQWTLFYNSVHGNNNLVLIRLVKLFLTYHRLAILQV